jgi:hypothetical protein
VYDLLFKNNSPTKDTTCGYIDRRLAGLRAEQEFMLLALILGNVEQITPLDQKQFVDRKKYGVPDFLASVVVPKQFTEGRALVQRLFVEVKSTSQERENFLIPIEVHNRLMTFCELYKPIPLYFAIKAKALGINPWFLLSAASVQMIGKIIKARPRGREEDCYSLSILDMPREDFSGLWLSNYAVYIPQGFRIRRFFDENSDSPVIDNKYGRIAEIEATNADRQKRVSFEKENFTEDLFSYVVLKRLTLGAEKVKKVGNGWEVVNETLTNYFVPFYWLVLDSYLDLREKFEPALTNTPNAEPTLSYFLDTFSEADQTIARGVRNCIWELHDSELILPMMMLPERYMNHHNRT